MSSYTKVYLEGKNDIGTLHKIFPAALGIFDGGNEKPGVCRKLEQSANAAGLVDRDFLTQEEILELQEKFGHRLQVLGRFCTENYLLEPDYLYEFAQRYRIQEHADWCSAAAIEAVLLEDARKLCYYTAANSLLSFMAKNLLYKDLTQQFKQYPILDVEEIRVELTARFGRLPAQDQLDKVLETWEGRATHIADECQALAGVHRLIDGKVLLRKVICDRIRQLDSKRFARFHDDALVEELADIASAKPPAELQQILKNFTLH